MTFEPYLTEDSRRRRYRELLDFYRGHASGRNPADARLSFNYAAAAVDKMTAYLMNGLTVRAAGSAGGVLERWQNFNCLDRLDYETETDTAVLGDGAWRLGWDETAGEVRVTAPDVAGLEADFGADGVTPRAVRHRYRLAPGDARGFSAGDDEAVVTEYWTADEYRVERDGSAVGGGVNPWGFIPYILFPNLPRPKSPWGVSDLENLIGPQAELDRALSQLSRILELSGNPIAVLENVESSSDIAVAPGAVWHLPEEARAYLLDLLQGGGGRLHLDYIDLLFRVIHDLAEVPRAAFGGVGRDISGVALELELQPLLHRVWRKRLIRTGVYRRRAEMALELYGRYLGLDFSGVEVQVEWAPVLPRDLGAAVQAERTAVEAGLRSRRRAMAALGSEDPSAEFDEWLEEEERVKCRKL